MRADGSAAQFLRGFEHSSAATAADQDDIEVVAPNWNTVAVYRACEWNVVSTFSGLFHLGISASEIRAALTLLAIPRAQWVRIADGIQNVMVPVAQRNLNPKPKRDKAPDDQ